MPAFRLALLLPLLLGDTDCAHNPPPAPAAGASTSGAVVNIDNQAAYDMDVYVLQRDGTVPLGFAPSKQVTKLPIPSAFIAGSGILRFEARPKPTGQRERSDPFTVHPGDELNWVIPPQ
jgi:hypothetical protein